MIGRRLWLLMIGSVVVQASCAFQHQPINIENPYARIARVTPGETRAEELPAILGTPAVSVIDVPPDRKGHVYSYGDSKTLMAWFVLFHFQKTNSGIDNAVFVVDAQGVVQEKFYGTQSKDLAWQFWPFGGE